ncbi:MAG: hypothetical protein Q8J59_08725 [Methylotenera sp.]|nr:hypothetical protein [Methylotenera sp.]MDP2281758.1 hypothetical protein [Methylotenera sp.]MDP3059294.1 hypothetical protein [Methylotenera sp.]
MANNIENTQNKRAAPLEAAPNKTIHDPYFSIAFLIYMLLILLVIALSIGGA